MNSDENNKNTENEEGKMPENNDQNPLETATAVEKQAEAGIDEVTVNLVAELVEAKKAAAEANDQMLRSQAELQNFRRRKAREAEERVVSANRRLLLDLLPVLDDFELAFANVPASLAGEQAAWVDGFNLIIRKLQTLLEREGVTAIAAGGEFDPNLHEAISMELNEAVESGHIIGELRRGYMLADKVLRPSSVRVAQ